MSKNFLIDGKGFLKLILSQRLPVFKHKDDAEWKKAFAFFPQPVSGKEGVVRKTVHFRVYEYRHYDELDEEDLVVWKMCEARLPGASDSYTKCIVGIGVV
jgi:hypothetical protein